MPVFISFPGVNRPIRCTFTDVLGLWPGVFTLDMVPQLSLPSIDGDLSLGDGNGGAVTLQNCRIDLANIAVTSNGHIERLKGFDPRWTWKFGELNGVYNIRRPDGTIEPDTEKTPQELADIMFRAMGVTNFDVSALPNSTRPYFNWRCDTPRPHFQKLLDDLGCTIAMNWVQFRPVIVRLGTGSNLPIGGEQTNSFGLDLSEAPKAIKVCCEKDIFQTKFKLEMVLPEYEEDGEENGAWKPADDVDYAPEGGWSVTDASDPLPDAEEPMVSIAKRWFGRVYRITTDDGEKITLPSYGEITDIGQVLPLLATKAEGYTTPEGRMEYLPPEIEGTYWLGDVNDDELEPADNTEPFTRVTSDFSVKREEGLVTFQKRMLQLNADDEFEAAELYLTIAHHLWETDTGAYTTYGLERQISSAPTMVQVEDADHLQRRFIGVYEDAELTGLTHNQNEVNAELEAILDSLQAAHLPTASNAKKYVGIGYIQLDGRRKQATYVVDADLGANTTGYLNTEGELGVTRAREIRRVAALQRNKRRRKPRRVKS